MPTPGTQPRGFRIPQNLWERIERAADDRGETYTEFVIRALWREVRIAEGEREPDDRP